MVCTNPVKMSFILHTHRQSQMPLIILSYRLLSAMPVWVIMECTSKRVGIFSQIPNSLTLNVSCRCSAMTASLSSTERSRSCDACDTSRTTSALTNDWSPCRCAVCYRHTQLNVLLSKCFWCNTNNDFVAISAISGGSDFQCWVSLNNVVSYHGLHRYCTRGMGWTGRQTAALLNWWGHKNS